VLVIAQKIVSKADGRYVNLDQVTPSPRAIEVALRCEKDPRLIEVILSESGGAALRPGLIITRHRLGFIVKCRRRSQQRCAGGD
jgi:coenzyme F420-0:L-glutamate ligase/coenzyme F420-1:gamma-L-glutamate ligase